QDLKLIQSCFGFLRYLQQQASIPLSKQFRMYHVSQMIFDNASENTGKSGGLGVLFQRAREEEWKSVQLPGAEAKDTYPDKSQDLPPCILKGCDDHVANLVSAQFSTRLISLLKDWGLTNLIVGKHKNQDSAAYVSKKLAKTVLRGPYSRLFREFAFRLCGERPP